MWKSLTIEILTEKGTVQGILHPVEEARDGVVLVGGAEGGVEGGVEGPMGLYEELAVYLQAAGVVVLRPVFRHPHLLAECAYDVLAAVAALRSRGVEQTALVGWSSGGAAATVADAASDTIPSLANTIIGLATIVGQSGVGGVGGKRSPGQLRLVGAGERPLPDRRSPGLSVRMAGRELVLYPGDGQGVEHHAVAMIERLYGWSRGLLRDRGGGGEAARRPVVPEPPPQPAPAEEIRATLRTIQLRLDQQWEGVLATLEGRDPQSAAAVQAALPPAGLHDSRGRFHAARHAWRHLDFQSRCDIIEAYSSAAVATRRRYA